jgi:hypothetical protein
VPRFLAGLVGDQPGLQRPAGVGALGLTLTGTQMVQGEAQARGRI